MPQSNDAHALAVRIAHRIAPDEVDIAPAVLDAALRGGREWEKLLRPRRSSLVGGIGAESAAGVLHIAFDWLRQYGPTLLDCASAGITILLGIRELAGPTKTRPEATAAQPPPDTQALIESLEAATAVLRDRLVAQGGPPRRAAAMTQELLEELDAVPAATRGAVERLSKRGRP